MLRDIRPGIYTRVSVYTRVCEYTRVSEAIRAVGNPRWRSVRSIST